MPNLRKHRNYCHPDDFGRETILTGNRVIGLQMLGRQWLESIINGWFRAG
jgi:hypothetical protein